MKTLSISSSKILLHLLAILDQSKEKVTFLDQAIRTDGTNYFPPVEITLLHSFENRKLVSIAEIEKVENRVNYLSKVTFLCVEDNSGLNIYPCLGKNVNIETPISLDENLTIISYSNDLQIELCNYAESFLYRIHQKQKLKFEILRKYYVTGGNGANNFYQSTLVNVMCVTIGAGYEAVKSWAKENFSFWNHISCREQGKPIGGIILQPTLYTYKQKGKSISY